MILFYFVLFIIGCLILIKSSEIIIKSLTQIASFLHLSEFTLSFVLVAFATSLPELFVGFSSILNQTPNISLGNIIGANIVNLTLVIGLGTILAKGIEIKSQIIFKDSLYTSVIAAAPLILLLDFELSRTDGLFLLLLFILYLINFLYQQKRDAKIFKDVSRKEFTRNFLFFVGGVILLLLSARIVVELVEILAWELKLPLILFGLIFLGMGTALPELIFNTQAVLKGFKELGIGNVLGSITVNSALILGLVALISPIKIINYSSFAIGAIFLLLLLILFIIFIKTKKFLSWKEGAILVILYSLFVFLELGIKLL